MNRDKLESMSVAGLVERFGEIALAQDEAILMDENAKFNRLYLRILKVEEELKRRQDDQRSALLPLLDHGNAQVRLRAAIAMLAVKPTEAREALQLICDRNEYPQAADARGMLRALAEGTYQPS